MLGPGSFMSFTNDNETYLEMSASASVSYQRQVLFLHVQYILNGSNTDGSFTVDDSNSFFSPYKILPIAQENKYSWIFSYFIMELYVVCTH